MDEALVRRLWLGGGWPAGALRGVDGTPLQVVYPGRQGHGAGPDLLDAIVALPDASLLRGDVELHVRASDWRVHGHAADPRYANVILHVVWRDDVGRPVERAGGRVPLTVALVDLPEPLLFERLRCPAPVSEPYHDWLRRLSGAELGAFLDRLGDERLAAKAARIAADLHALGGAEALHRALLDALGYSHNRPGFASLAQLVSADALRSVALAAPTEAAAEWDCLAFLFASAGLLDEPRLAGVRDDDGRALAHALRERAVGLGVELQLPAGAWELVGVRPANRPARRLAALARLAARSRRRPLDEAVLEALAMPEPKAAARALVELARVPGVVGEAGATDVWPADFWAWHHDFGRRLPGAPLALLGEDRARAVTANVLLPWALAAADARGDGALEAAARAAWAAAPAGAVNWILTEMRPLLGRLPIGRARREQGAIELYRRCCEERRCATCPAASAQAAIAPV